MVQSGKIKLDFCGESAILYVMETEIENLKEEVKQLKAIERRRKLKQIWESIHPIDRPTWEQWKRGMVTLPQTPRDRDFPIAAMEDRKRRAKEWAEHMAKKS